ncbi:MAG: hypothetical protein H7Y15_06355 [Pseudonocardia sp.]|nr:hypothetical protein [Pseudonocardia sp.]
MADDTLSMSRPSDAQRFFEEMFVGVLLYSVVLGFFNDYTDVLQTASYSVTFAVAFVMQVLTYLTFALKRRVVARIRARGGPRQKAGIVLGVWLVMFLSKFVFLAVIDVIFGDAVTISGFIGLLLVIATMTIAQKLVGLAYDGLGRRTAGSVT